MSILSASSAASTASLFTGRLSVNGLISGFDTDNIVQGLLAIEQQRIQVIDQRKSRIANEQTAFKAIEAKLLALQGQMTQLSRTQNGLFDARKVTSSDPDALSSAASSSAAPGVFSLRVNSLARAHLVAAQGFDSVTSKVTQGTLQVKIGDAMTTVTVDSSNDTLQGLADALNHSGTSLTASVVNDGSGEGRQSYRLVLAAKATGAANRIVITNNLGASGAGATKPVFDSGSIGSALTTTTNTSTSVSLSNAGAGYVGSSNNNYHFTVMNGGTVGTDNGIAIAYSDTTGANTGTITINQADVNSFKDVSQGIRIQFAAGTLVAGDTFDVKAFTPVLQDAGDASVTLGSGSGALIVTSAKNQFDSLISGVAVQVRQSDPNEEITLTVSSDTDKMKEGIQDFVSAFNNVMSYIDERTNFDAETKQAGILLGNRQALTIQDQIRSVVTSVVDGARPGMNYLGALGITTDDKGRLTVNDAKLMEVLTGARAGVTLDDVHKLFALTGKSSNPGIEFVTGSTKSRASTTPYSVQITQAADKATLLATNAMAASTVIGTGNNTLQVIVDGVTSSLLTLPNGSYTPTALAQTVQSAINGDTTLGGRKVLVDILGDKLRLVSDRFGSASRVTLDSGTAVTSLGFAAGTSAQGRDVVGSFSVDGSAESALGTGQFLVGNSANANTADMQLRVNLTPAQVGTGITANVTVSRGVASRLDSVLASMFDPVHGRMKTLNDGFDESLQELDRQKAVVDEAMETRRQSLLRQFAAMERTLSQLRSASNFLTAQAGSLQPK